MDNALTFLLIVFDDSKDHAIEVAFLIEDTAVIPSDLEIEYPMEPECLKWLNSFFGPNCKVIHARMLDGAARLPSWRGIPDE